MKQIRLSTKHDGEDVYTIVDDWNYEWLNQWKWRLQVKNGKIMCVLRHIYIKDGKYSNLRIHNLILGYYGPLTIDHINRNVLDNREENLRLATMKQQAFNRKKMGNSTNKYKGVHKQPYGKWHARARGKYIGAFNSEEEAALRYNEYAKEHYGEFALLNEVNNG